MAWAAWSQVVPALGTPGRAEWLPARRALGRPLAPRFFASQHRPKRVPELEWGQLNPPPPRRDPGQLTSLPKPQLPHLQNESRRHTLLSLSPWAPPSPPLSCPPSPPPQLAELAGVPSLRGLVEAWSAQCGPAEGLWEGVGACGLEGRSCGGPQRGGRRRGARGA